MATSPTNGYDTVRERIVYIGRIARMLNELDTLAQASPERIEWMRRERGICSMHGCALPIAGWCAPCDARGAHAPKLCPAHLLAHCLTYYHTAELPYTAYAPLDGTSSRLEYLASLDGAELARELAQDRPSSQYPPTSLERAILCGVHSLERLERNAGEGWERSSSASWYGCGVCGGIGCPECRG